MKFSSREEALWSVDEKNGTFWSWDLLIMSFDSHLGMHLFFTAESWPRSKIAEENAIQI